MMNFSEAVELVRTGKVTEDQLAQLMKTDLTLAHETDSELEKMRMVWTNVPGAGETSANLADDRGSEAFLVPQPDGSFKITGHDGDLHMIEPEYAKAFGLTAIGQIRNAEGRILGARES